MSTSSNISQSTYPSEPETPQVSTDTNEIIYRFNENAFVSACGCLFSLYVVNIYFLQGTAKSRITALDQSLNNVDLGSSPETTSKEKEMHQKRIQALRKQLEYLKVTEWVYDYDKGFIQ